MMSRLTIFLVMSVALPVGCAQDGQFHMEDVHTAYQSGRYVRALHRAEKIMMSGKREKKDEAAYMAGMIAYQMNDQDSALRYLQRAVRSSSPALSGDALVMVGLIYSDLNHYEKSARAYLDATRLLVATKDRANAYFFAAKAQQHLGRWAEARTSLSLAKSSSSDLEFRRRVSQEMSVTGFTLQTGAFSEQSNAYHAAEEVLAKAIQLRLGRPRLVPAVDHSDRSLYLVQVGQFSSHASAQAARDKMGKPSVMIVPLAAAR